MKKLEKQFLSALKQAVKGLGLYDYNYLMEVCNPPYSQLIVKAHPRIRFNGSGTYYAVNIDMTVKHASSLEAFLMEIAHKLYLVSMEADGGILSAFLNGNATPEIDRFLFRVEAYSWDSRGSAIFHADGGSNSFGWLLFPEEAKNTPFSYEKEYPNEIIRKEAY